MPSPNPNKPPAMKKLLALVVALFAVVAIPGTVAAQTTVNIAVLDSVILSPDDVVVIAGDTGTSKTFAGGCMAFRGFSGEYPLRNVVIADPGGTSSTATAVTTNDVSGRLSNFVLVSVCNEGADTYRVYTADVLPTPLRIAFIDTIAVDPGMQIVATGPPLGQVPGSACWANQGFPAQLEAFHAFTLTGSTGSQELVGFGSVPIPPGTRLEIGEYVASCNSEGFSHDIYDASVSPTPTIKVALPDGATLGEGGDVVITGAGFPGSSVSLTFSSQCMRDQGFESEHPVHRVVSLDPGGAGVDVFRIAVTDVPVPPGTRLLNLVLVKICLDGGVTYRIYSGVVASPTQLGVALVVAPSGVTLLPDDEAVVKSDEDGTGIADTVCVRPGSPALHTELWSDIPLLRGDRLTDFQFLFYDPATGETYYDAYLEY